MTRDRLRVGPRDAARVRGKPLFRDRAQVLAVRVEEVLASDMTGRVEEREADPDGDLEDARPLAPRRLEQPRVEPCEVLGARKRGRVAADVRERLAQGAQLERRDVDETRGRARHPFERAQEIGRGPRRGPRGQRPGADELGDVRVEVDARAVGHVGGGGQDPERREAERGDRAELDRVPDALPHREPAGVGLELGLGRDAGLDAADELDRHAQEVLRGRLVQPRLPDEPREGERERLVEDTAEQRGDRPDNAFGDGEQEGAERHGR